MDRIDWYDCEIPDWLRSLADDGGGHDAGRRFPSGAAAALASAVRDGARTGRTTA